MSKSTLAGLTGGGLLARNTVISIVGQGVPLLVAVFTIPLLISGLGTDRYGVLTLAWMVVGYFSLFDLGLGRALTKLVAEKVESPQERDLPTLVWTTLFLMLVLGLVGAVVMLLLSPWLVYGALKVPRELQVETLHAFYLLALSTPLVITSAGFSGILVARQRFGLLNAVDIPMGVFTFLGPLLILPFSQSLFYLVAILVAGRLLAWLAYLRLCFHVLPEMRGSITLRRSVVTPLLRFGSWMTVSNVIGPLMVYLDRFLIGGMVSVAAVAYYTTPYSMVTKLWIVPRAIAGVLFPAFAASFTQDRNRATLLFGRGVKYTFLALFPVILVIVTLAYEGLDLWLGAEFAQNSTRVLQLLAVGVFINSVAQIAFAQLQGAGRSDLTAKLHLVELPFYLVLVWWLISAYGIEGAAIAWVVRVSVDMLFLFGVSQRILPTSTSGIRRMALLMGGALLTLALASLLQSIVMKAAFLLLMLVGFVLVAWFLVLDPDERMLVKDRLKSLTVMRRSG